MHKKLLHFGLISWSPFTVVLQL